MTVQRHFLYTTYMNFSTLSLLGIAGGIFATIGIVPNMRDIIWGKTRPERATWLIWVVLGCIAFASQLAKGATDSLWMTGLETLGQLVVLVLAFKFGVGGLQKKDIIALSIAGLGLILWYFTKEAAVALYIIIAIDFIGSFLTIQKSYLDPGSETLTTWILAWIGGLLTTFAVGKLDIVLVSYPIFIMLMNGMIAIAILLGRNGLKKKF